MIDIKPAMTPEQWESTYSRYAEIRSASYLLDCEEDYFAKLAICNWLLPDDDPRKITREDVALLRGCADFFRREKLEHPRLAELDAIAGKIAALLQPEPTG